MIFFKLDFLRSDGFEIFLEIQNKIMLKSSYHFNNIFFKNPNIRMTNIDSKLKYCISIIIMNYSF